MHVDWTTVTGSHALSPRLYVPFLLGSALLFPMCAARGVHATMPSAPLEMVLESAGTPAVDVDLTVTLTVRPLVDAARLVVKITLPEGVDRVAGETEWIGPVRAQESRVLSVIVRPRRAEFSVIQGAARMEFPDGTALGDLRSLALPLGERSKQTLGLSPPKKTTTGEPVIEFRDAP